MKSYFKIFEFISDKKLKGGLILDYKEVLTCLNRQASKAAVVLSGGIVEAILINRALSIPENAKDKIKKVYLKLTGEQREIEKMDLSPLIRTLSSLEIITTPQAGRSDILRDYRNLIHPYKKGDRPTKADAISVKKLLDDLIKQFEIPEKLNVDNLEKVNLFLNHSAYKKKRETAEYREILNLFIEKHGSVAFEDFLNLQLFKDKPNPSKSLISNLTYLKKQGLCTYDEDSWKGYPINRYESWSMNQNTLGLVAKYLKGMSPSYRD